MLLSGLNQAASSPLILFLLSSEGPFTMFGPTDEAFAALPEEVLNALMSNMTLLRQALSYHVHMGKFESKMIKNELKVSTLLKPAEIRLNTYDKNMVSVDGLLSRWTYV